MALIIENYDKYISENLRILKDKAGVVKLCFIWIQKQVN